MKKGAIIALVVALVLVIGAEVLVFLHLRSQAAGPAPEQAAVTESPMMTQAPPPTIAPATPTPLPTMVPVTPTPIPTQAPITPTPIPTEVPTPTPAPSNSGKCSSDTGVGLNMYVSWKTENLGNGTTKVNIVGKIKSYSLDVGGTSVTVTLGDKSTTCDAPAFHIGNSGETTSDLFSTSLEMPSGTTAELKVEWGSRVTYSGVTLMTITAKDTVTT